MNAETPEQIEQRLTEHITNHHGPCQRVLNVTWCETHDAPMSPSQEICDEFIELLRDAETLWMEFQMELAENAATIAELRAEVEHYRDAFDPINRYVNVEKSYTVLVAGNSEAHSAHLVLRDLRHVEAERDVLLAEVERLQTGLAEESDALGAELDTADEWFARTEAAEAEVDRLRQGIWDMCITLGFDNDGDPTPRALVSDIVQLGTRIAQEAREGWDEALDELP